MSLGMTQFCSFLWLSCISIARTWKQPKCPSTEEWIKNMWYIYTVEYYSTLFCSCNPRPRVRDKKKTTELRACYFLILNTPLPQHGLLLLILRNPEMLLVKDLYKVSSFWESQSRRILWDAPVFELFKEKFWKDERWREYVRGPKKFKNAL